MQNIAVLGLGKVGGLAARLLQDSGLSVLGIDRAATAVGSSFRVEAIDVRDPAALAEALAGQDAVLSCLPYALNRDVAQIAHDRGLHYFDLTEDVATTRAVKRLGETARGVMAPQCGLAPGFVGIMGAHLIAGFEHCRACRLRVGALPQHPTGLLGYAFNWSPEGVVNEYLNDCEVIEDGQRKLVSPLEWREAVYISGMPFEAFTTSGGLGTMCETYLGRVDNLDYRTLRYPGHMDLMNFFFHELRMRERREEAGRILVDAKPPVNDDVVYVHVSAEGIREGQPRREEFVRRYLPMTLAGAQRTAIAWTTSASVVAVIEMVRQGRLPDRGFLKQEAIPLDGFFATRTGALFRDHGAAC